METLENKIRAILNSGKKLTLKWDCGGDEALVYSFIDGNPTDFNDEVFEELEMFIINTLDLPSAGEFSMNGKGEIVLEDDNIYLICKSILQGYEDYTMDGESNGWKEVNEVEDTFSGKFKVFK